MVLRSDILFLICMVNLDIDMRFMLFLEISSFFSHVLLNLREREMFLE